MQNIIEQFRKFEWLQALLSIVFGVCLLINPNLFFRVVILILGVYVIFIGVSRMVQKFRQQKNEFTPAPSDVLLIIVGIAIILLTSTLFSIVNIVFGLVILANGISKLMSGIGLRRDVVNAGITLIIYGILLAVAGAIIILNPFKTLMVVFRIIGVMMIIMGVGDLISFFGLKKISKHKDGEVTRIDRD